MIKIEPSEYYKLKPLIQSRNELSVIAVLNNELPGEAYVDDTEHPSVTLIRTSECNYIAGRTDVDEFNQSVKDEMDFWDPLTPDTEDWNKLIPLIHPNRFIRGYIRRHYILNHSNWSEMSDKSFIPPLPEGFFLEAVELDHLRNSGYENADKVIEWAGNLDSDELFHKAGAGFYIRNDKTIVSWSCSDCCFETSIAIGIKTEEPFRNRGFAKAVITQMVKTCFEKGYKEIEWLCVDTNKGSSALAECIGFKLQNRYDSFSTYPPIENLKDLTEDGWADWADYLSNAAVEELRLLTDCFLCYVKANEVEQAAKVQDRMKENKIKLNFDFNWFIEYLHGYGMAGAFQKGWME